MLGRRSMRNLMQLCCIFLLLFAQQTALTHALWHAAGGHESHAHAAGGHAHDHDAHDRESDAQGALCDSHSACGTLLGGHHGATAALGALDAACAHAASHFTGRITAEAVPAVSRGPPLLL